MFVFVILLALILVWALCFQCRTMMVLTGANNFHLITLQMGFQNRLECFKISIHIMLKVARGTRLEFSIHT